VRPAIELDIGVVVIVRFTSRLFSEETTMPDPTDLGYEAAIQISIGVKDGPPAVQQKQTVKNVKEARSTRLKMIRTQRAASLALNEGPLVFFAISAPRFTYKDCGKDQPGLFMRLGSAAGAGSVIRSARFQENGSAEAPKDDSKAPESVESPPPMTGSWFALLANQVYLARPGQALDEFLNTEFKVKDEMFDCTKPDPDPFVITITYGLGDPDLPYKCFCNDAEIACEPDAPRCVPPPATPTPSVLLPGRRA
jgi:hypothetical protein